MTASLQKQALTEVRGLHVVGDHKKRPLPKKRPINQDSNVVLERELSGHLQFCFAKFETRSTQIPVGMDGENDKVVTAK